MIDPLALMIFWAFSPALLVVVWMSVAWLVGAAERLLRGRDGRDFHRGR